MRELSPIILNSKMKASNLSKALANVRVKITNGKNSSNSQIQSAGSIYNVCKKTKTINISHMPEFSVGLDCSAPLESELRQWHDSKLADLNSTNYNTSQGQHGCGSPNSNMQSKINLELNKMTRLNNELRKFKNKLDEQERGKICCSKKIDGLENMADLVHNIVITKLGSKSNLFLVLKILH